MDKHDTDKERDRDKNFDIQNKNPQVAKAAADDAATAGPAVRRGDENAGLRGGRMQGMMNNAVSGTAQAGSGMVGGVTHVATDMVHGIGAVGGEVVNVVRDTANTAIAGVGSIGETAVHTVTGLLADLISGIRDIGSSAMRRGSTGTGDAMHPRETRYRQQEEATH